jgi:hypothetical protein
MGGGSTKEIPVSTLMVVVTRKKMSSKKAISAIEEPFIEAFSRIGLLLNIVNSLIYKVILYISSLLTWYSVAFKCY